MAYRRELWRIVSGSEVRVMCNITPEAVSKALGISLSEVLNLYFGELDNAERGHLIGNTIDKRRTAEEGEEWSAEEARR
jgi:hypothetical protein